MKYLILLGLAVLTGCQGFRTEQVDLGDGVVSTRVLGERANGLMLGDRHIPQSQATKGTDSEVLEEVGIIGLEMTHEFLMFTSETHYSEISNEEWDSVKEGFEEVTFGDIVVWYSRDTGRAVIVYDGQPYLSDEQFKRW